MVWYRLTLMNDTIYQYYFVYTHIALHTSMIKVMLKWWFCSTLWDDTYQFNQRNVLHEWLTVSQCLMRFLKWKQHQHQRKHTKKKTVANIYSFHSCKCHWHIIFIRSHCYFFYVLKIPGHKFNTNEKSQQRHTNNKNVKIWADFGFNIMCVYTNVCLQIKFVLHQKGKSFAVLSVNNLNMIPFAQFCLDPIRSDPIK